MLHLDSYPEVALAAIRQFSPALPGWAAAARVSLDDVRQEIAFSVLAGQNTACAVPKALGLRRLGKRWVAIDPAAHHCLDVGERADFLHEQVQEEQEEQEELGIGGWEVVAKRLGVTRRRVQQLAKAQRARVVTCGDLFGGAQ